MYMALVHTRSPAGPDGDNTVASEAISLTLCVTFQENAQLHRRTRHSTRWVHTSTSCRDTRGQLSHPCVSCHHADLSTVWGKKQEAKLSL